jgi:hypothetical protein
MVSSGHREDSTVRSCTVGQKTIFDIPAMARRIVAEVRQCNEEQARAGAEWYANAKMIAVAMSAETRLPVRTCAGVIAALSPRIDWDHNVIWAWSLLRAAVAGRDCPPCNTTNNRNKAWAIAHGADPDATLTGPKTNDFYHNIMGDWKRVTCDSWAALVALGYPLPNGVKGSMYKAITAAYRLAADWLGELPAIVQAKAWIRRRMLEVRVSRKRARELLARAS